MENMPITDGSAAMSYVMALADVDIATATIASLATGTSLYCDADAITIGLRMIGIYDD